MSQRMPPVQYIMTGVSGDTFRRWAGSSLLPDASVGVSLKVSCRPALALSQYSYCGFMSKGRGDSERESKGSSSVTTPKDTLEKYSMTFLQS
jgi:hypothetical protein